MKKRFLIVLLAVAGLVSCSNNTNSVKVNLKNADDKMVYLYKYEGENPIAIDSAIVENGMVVFNVVKGEQNASYFLSVKDNRNNVMLFPDNNDITVDADLKNLYDAEITGSLLNDLYTEFNSVMNEFDSEMEDVYNLYRNASEQLDETLMEKYEKEYDSINEKQYEYMKDFLKRNSNNVVAHYVLFRNSYMFELDDLKDFVKDVDKETKSYFLDKINDKIEMLQRVAIGNKYVDFTMTDVDGNMVSLSELVGKSKLLLVDFWASWCGPCRAENPHVVETYNKYHEQGFDVLGVSLDQNKESWIKAIEDDNLTWKHLSDLQGWNNEASKLYGVNSIPSNVLLDSNGIIVAKNLRGDDLVDKVNELLNK